MALAVDEPNGHIYHERQRKQLCLLHTLNNLFQRQEFEQHELDQICERLILSFDKHPIEIREF